MITAKNVVKSYSRNLVLDDINLHIPKGSIYGLLGPNGAGKTSFIRIINQITAPDKGEILLHNNPIKPSDIGRIGYLPEERGLYQKMKVGEQVLYLARLKGLNNSEAKERAKKWFDRLDMNHFWEKKVEDLSKGMAQKVQFVTTVMHEPELLIFDEPFTGFDPINSNLIKSEILRLREEGATVIFSTHRMESVEEICDHIGLINNGRVMVEGPLLDIRKHHQNGIYSFILKNPVNQWSEGTVLKEHKHHKGHSYTVKFEGYPGAVVGELANLGELVSFDEVLPSVQDIFIEIVEDSTKSNSNE